jgi:hypothetical protein
VHGPLGQQLEDGRANIAAPAASPASAAPRAAGTWPEAESAALVEAELEPATGTEAGTEARTEAAALSELGVVAVIVAAHVLAEVAARLAALLVKRSSIAGAEAEAKAAGWWCEWVAHYLVFLNVGGKRRMCFRYVNDISETIAMQRSVF